MGEIADMMLDGTLCEGCGVLLDDGGDSGYPRRCSACQKDDASSAAPKDDGRVALGTPTPKIPCPTCGKRLKVTGISAHWNEVHKAKGP